jgi:hypothetical protein
MSSRAFSINDEMLASPKLRKDQRNKIRNLVRTNYEHPIVALGLVRDALKGYPTFCIISDDETCIEVTIKDYENKIYTQYMFPFQAPVLMETPTLG